MEQNKSSDIWLESSIVQALADSPDPMSRTEFRRVCHIGTRTALYLLRSGLVPCENTGKKTRCYKIAKADVAIYLRRRAADPVYYTLSSRWYADFPHRKPPQPTLTDISHIDRERLRQVYAEKLAVWPDVLDMAQIEKVTGYRRKVIAKWCAEGRLRVLMREPKVMVPKVWLLEFLCSDDYLGIVRKCEQHLEVLHQASEV